MKFHRNLTNEKQADTCGHTNACMDRLDEGDKHILSMGTCLKMNQILFGTQFFLSDVYEIHCFTLHCVCGGNQNILVLVSGRVISGFS
jgi:hypothetical protein